MAESEFVGRLVHRRSLARENAATWASACLVVALLALAAAPASAQVRNFTNFTPAEGLPQSQVLALHQDARGFLWIGTYGGLTRFDGVEFQTLTRRDGLSSNTVQAIAEDSEGRLLVGTIGGGVCVRETTGFRCLSLPEGMPDADVYDILSDYKGTFWVATKRGVARVSADGTVQAFTEQHGLPAREVTRLALDGQHRLWAATRAGAARLDGERFVVTPADPLGRRQISALFNTPKGFLAASQAEVLTRQSGAFRTMLSLDPGTIITDAASDHAGQLWIASNRGVAIALPVGGPTQSLSTDHGLLDNNVNTLLIDREQNIWLGTESGLSRLRPGPFSLFTRKDGLPHAFVRALTEDINGRLWVGTRDGVAIRDGDRFESIPLDGAPDRRVYALGGLPDGSMLVGTREGLVLYSEGVKRVYHQSDGLPDDFITSLLADPRGGYWVGTANGLGRFEGRRVHTMADPRLATPFVASMTYDRRGRLWIGRRGGGVLIVDGSTVTALGPSEGLTDQTVWALAEDDATNMWVGTNGDGAFRIDPAGRIGRFNTATGLVNDFVWQILSDRRGSVWFFTNRGLNRYAQGRLAHYGRADGLLVLEGSVGAARQSPGGGIWFGTGSGLLHYQPALDVTTPVAPLVYIESATIGGQKLPFVGARVPAGTNALQLHFISPWFRDPSRAMFRHRLSARDPWSEWSPERTVTFGRMWPDRYEFEVEASTGTEGETPARAGFEFTVLPLFWQTWWFTGLMLVTVAGVGLLIPAIRNRYLERDRQRLGRLVAEHTSALAAQNAALEREVSERKAAEEALRAKEEQLRHAQKLEAVGRLAGGIAHDFNNLLTAIIGHTEFAQETLAPQSSAAADLAIVRQTADRASTLVGQLLAFSRQQMIKRRTLDLNVVAPEAARMLHRVLGSDIVLQLDLSASPVWVL
ncbi:MAG: two-component regulator propeller domain-containing protein, partial [Acidobacteriota bacterium]